MAVCQELKGARLKQIVNMPFKKIIGYLLISDFKIPYTFPLLTSSPTPPHLSLVFIPFHHFLVLPLGLSIWSEPRISSFRNFTLSEAPKPIC